MSTPGLEPINRLKQPCAPEAIEAAAREALNLGLQHVQRARDWSGGVENKRILEVGPGPNFASALILLAFDALAPVTVVDPWIAQWDPDYHPAVYARVAELLFAEHPEADQTVLREVARAGRHPEALLRLVETPAEDLGGLEGELFDLVVSNAVLEHVPDMVTAADQMFAVTRPGGMGLHMVDLRDHAHFGDTPLDYLLQTREEAEEWYARTHYHLGSLRRKKDYDQVFADSGFEVVDDYVTLRAEPAYFESFKKRLRAAKGAAYQHYPEDDLDVLGVFYVLRKSAR